MTALIPNTDLFYGKGATLHPKENQIIWQH